MKATNTLHSILTLGAVWLVATALPTSAQVETVPGLIDVTVSLDCVSGDVHDFLTPAEFICSGTASAKTRPAGSPVYYFGMTATTFTDPLMQGVNGNAVDPATISLSALEAQYEVNVDAYLGFVHIPGFLGADFAWYPYDANATLWLANYTTLFPYGRKTYVLEQQVINPVWPLSSQATTDSVTEHPGLLEVGIKCPNLTYVVVNSAKIVATLDPDPSKNNMTE